MHDNAFDGKFQIIGQNIGQNEGFLMVKINVIMYIIKQMSCKICNC